MNNYEYIIASLPELKLETNGGPDIDATLGEIRSQLCKRDIILMDTLMDGWDSSKLNRDFYLKTTASSSTFISRWFSFDLLVRNRKAAYLNRELGRDDQQDIMELGLPEEDQLIAEYQAEIDAVLDSHNILERERGLDQLMWDRAEELSIMHVFDIDVILAAVAKLMIVGRWIKLDAETGRQLFRRFVQETRNTRQ